MSANGHISESFVSTVLEGSTLTDVSMLAFPDPKHFVARELHCHLELWSYVASLTPCDLAPQLLNWIMNSVDVHEFFQHFKGCYKGEAYDSTLPPRRVFLNHPSSKPFVKFISAKLLDRLSTGAISLWGKVGGGVQPPHLAMPLTVEPSKPRLCNDCFLNLWIADRPFQLDSLRDVVRYTPLDSFQTICDGKSGYDHIFLLSLVEHISLSVGGGAGFLLVILFLSGGNHPHTFTTLLVSSHPIIFVPLAFTAPCISTTDKWARFILLPRLFPHPVKISVLSVTQISPLLMWPLLFPTLWFH